MTRTARGGPGERVDHGLLERLEAGLHAAAGDGREIEVVPGFRIYLSPTSDAPNLSLAIPTADAPADLTAALRLVREAFERRGRTARIEAFAELHPDLGAAAAAAGYGGDGTAAVMVLPRGHRAPPPPAVGTVRTFRADDRPHLEAALRGAHRAFGGTDDAGALEWLPQLEDGLRRKTVLGCAVEADGMPVAGATVLIGGDVGELAGVWTAPGWRRRGFARHACATVLDASFARGCDLAWLSAAADAVGLYASLGFVRVGTQVNLRVAPPA